MLQNIVLLYRFKRFQSIPMFSSGDCTTQETNDKSGKTENIFWEGKITHIYIYISIYISYIDK